MNGHRLDKGDEGAARAINGIARRTAGLTGGDLYDLCVKSEWLPPFPLPDIRPVHIEKCVSQARRSLSDEEVAHFESIETDIRMRRSANLPAALRSVL